MAQLFSQSWIEKVKDSCDIVDVISHYMPLKQKGRTFWGNCPFHHENEPSFAVSQEGQFFNCFGCHVGGNVITFVSKYESLTFTEALKLLAKQNNIELPENIDDEQVQKNAALKKQMLELNRKVAKFYYDQMMSPAGAVARQYLYNRGLTDNIITRFGLGYSPDWNKVVDFLNSQKISLELAYKAGIVGQTKNGRYYDFFAERICFPIINSMGEVLGFSARVITKDYQGGKYKNSPDSIVFNKSSIVYGINLLKRAGKERKLDYAIICEGQMDVIALNKCGFDTAIACMGTALTRYHAREIKRFVDKVIVCFDGDGAGIKATNRSLDILEKNGLSVFVVSLPDGMDPDEFTKKYGKEKFQNLLDNAKAKNDYVFEVIKKAHNLGDNKGKSDFVKEILEFIDGLDTSSDKEIYLNQVSTLVKIPVDVLKQDMSGIDNVIFAENQFEVSSTYEDSLKMVFSAYLYKKSYAKNLDIKVVNNTFYSILLNYLGEQKNFETSDIFISLENKFGQENILPIKNFRFEDLTDEQSYFNDCYKNLKITELEYEYNMLTEDVSVETNTELRRQKLTQMDRIFSEIQKIKMEE